MSSGANRSLAPWITSALILVACTSSGLDGSVVPTDAGLGIDMDAAHAIDLGTLDLGAIDSGSTYSSPGCGTPQASGQHTSTTTVRGEERTYLVSVPDDYDPTRPAALHLSFHGCGGTSMTQFGRAGVEDAFGARAINVYPQGLATGGCPTGWELTNDGADVEFVDSVRATLSNEYCIDTRGMVLVGASFGGDFVNTYACARPENIVVAAAQAASPWSPSGCVGPVAMIATYATGDIYAEEYTGPAFEISREFWSMHNGCTGATDPEVPSPCVRYRGCIDTPLIACEVIGGDHGTFPDDFGVNLLRWYREQLGEIARP